MSSIVEQFGTATVLLFSARWDAAPPSQKRLRELLGVSDLRVYSANGAHGEDLACLTIACEIAEGGNQRRDRPCTHAAISRSKIAPNGLALIELAPILIGGFRVDDKRILALFICLRLWNKTRQIRASAEEWITSARNNIDELKLLQIQDESVTNVDNQLLVELEEGYGIKAHAQTTQLIKSWISGTSWIHEDGSSIED